MGSPVDNSGLAVVLVVQYSGMSKAPLIAALVVLFGAAVIASNWLLVRAGSGLHSIQVEVDAPPGAGIARTEYRLPLSFEDPWDASDDERTAWKSADNPTSFVATNLFSSKTGWLLENKFNYVRLHTHIRCRVTLDDGSTILLVSPLPERSGTIKIVVPTGTSGNCTQPTTQGT